MRSFKDLSPIVKWAGGKEQELKYILPNLPSDFSRFVEPFVGGGAVYFSMNCKDLLINDKSLELTNLYNNVKYHNSDFVQKLQNIYDTWTSLENILDENLDFMNNVYLKFKANKITKDKLKIEIASFVAAKEKSFKQILKGGLNKQYQIFLNELIRNIGSKLIRMAEIEQQKGNLSQEDIYDNFECALKGSFYMFIRALYNQNQTQNSEYFYFIREYCYSSMFRYNANGEFNVPYGGISYNRKNFQRKIDYIKSNELQSHFVNTDIYNLDFEEFLNKIKLKATDFIFLDPPYDTDFSSYVNNSFDKKDQGRLADYLINKCPAKFMLVIKNTNFISELYSNKGLHINSFDKTYMVSFKGRNNRDCEHLIITNYPLPSEEKVVTSLNIKRKKQLQYA